MRAFMIVVLSCLMSGVALAVGPSKTNSSRSGSQITESREFRSRNGNWDDILDVRNNAESVVTLSNSGPDADGVPVTSVPKSSTTNAYISSGRADEPLEERLKQLINQSSVMLFMKGTPSQPGCGFSRQVVEILNASGVSYKTFDILEDEEVRQGLKDFSQWQTYPQLYVNGSLVGGLDVIRDMKEMGTLQDVLTGKHEYN